MTRLALVFVALCLLTAPAFAHAAGRGFVMLLPAGWVIAGGALAIYAAQTSALVIGHVIGVAVAHSMAVEEGLSAQRVMKLELPLALCMVAYTGFGLWLLGAPAIS